MKEDRYTNLILEEMREQIAAIHEITLDTRKKVEPIPQMQTDIAELKSDMKVVKRAITGTNKDLKLLEKRVTRLEQRIA